MTLIKTINDNDTIRKTGIKTVKNSVIYEYNNILYCRHYDTVIFAYDMKNNKVEAIKNLSPTSDRQIRYLCKSLGLTWDEIADKRAEFNFSEWKKELKEKNKKVLMEKI